MAHIRYHNYAIWLENDESGYWASITDLAGHEVHVTVTVRTSTQAERLARQWIDKHPL